MIIKNREHRCLSRYLKTWQLFTPYHTIQSPGSGFTLLELIVVVIVISVLAAISIPVFVGQIGKARESEMKIQIGALARSQMSYHYTNGVFASTMAQIQADSGPVSTFYYTFPDPITDPTGTLSVKHQAIAVDPGQYQTRDYAIGVYAAGGGYNRSTCQGAAPGASVNVGDTHGDPCTNNGIKIE